MFQRGPAPHPGGRLQRLRSEENPRCPSSLLAFLNTHEVFLNPKDWVQEVSRHREVPSGKCQRDRRSLLSPIPAPRHPFLCNLWNNPTISCGQWCFPGLCERLKLTETGKGVWEPWFVAGRLKAGENHWPLKAGPGNSLCL